MKKIYLILIGLITVTFASSAQDDFGTKIPDHLYLVGGFNNWNGKTAPEFEKTGDNKFSLTFPILTSDNVSFQVITAPDYAEPNNYKYIPATNNDVSFDVLGTTAKEYNFKKYFDNNNTKDFNIKKGVYKFTVTFTDGESGTIKIEHAEDGFEQQQGPQFSIRFWEGPAFKGLGGGAANFQPYTDIPSNDYDYYKLDLNLNEDDDAKIKYVSQCEFLAKPGTETKIRYTRTKATVDGVETYTWKSETIGGDYDSYYDKLEKYYFDAHTSDAFVPTRKTFWCGNSRMEVGMEMRAIYLRVKKDLKSETPYAPIEVMFSSDGTINHEAPKQQLLNSDTYTLTLSDGTVYEAMRRTQDGVIDVPFIRHNSAEWGYVINIGHNITTEKDEPFVLTVKKAVRDNDKTVSFGEVGEINTLVGSKGTSSSTIPVSTTIKKGLTFNQIILMVSGPEYDQYSIYLSDGSEYPEKYEAHSTNPKLKIWNGNNASWKALYDIINKKYAENQTTYTYTKDGVTYNTEKDGSVYYFEFQPVKSHKSIKLPDGSTKEIDANTNLYHLDFPEPVTIRKAEWDNTKNSGENDQFNIIDQDGYDISNPFRGSQYIYPESWWCANPNLMDDNLPEGSRTYLGKHKFREIPDLPSQVDLSFNLTDTDEEKITGITIFKIIGKVYSVYTEAERYANLYYLYVHKDTGNTEQNIAKAEAKDMDPLIAKCEMTSPILMLVKDPIITTDSEYFDTEKEKRNNRPLIYSSDNNDLKEFKPLVNTEFNNPADYAKRFNQSTNKFYHLQLSDISLEGNEDLNYVLNNSDLRFVPNGEKNFEFIDVTGTQLWSASSETDKLRINKWGNYYSGYYNDYTDNNNKLSVQRPYAEYFKVAMGTNPDQARYLLLSEDLTLLARPNMDYSSIKAEGHQPEEQLIYPYVDLSTIFIWRDGYTIDYQLDFLKSGSVNATKTYNYNSFDKIPNKTTVEVDDLKKFYPSGETPVEVNLGKFFIDPDMVTSAKGTVNYAGETPTSEDYTTPDFNLNLATPAFNNFIAEKKTAFRYYDETETDETKRFKTRYTTNLSWATDDKDYPREYNIWQYELTGKTDYADEKYYNEDTHLKGDDKTINDSSTEWQAETNNATDLTINPDAEIAIGYRGQAVYHYAIPESNAVAAADFILPAAETDTYYKTMLNGFKSADKYSDNLYAHVKYNFNETSSGVESVGINADNSPVEYFNLQGMKVENPAAGIYIRRQGKEVTKVMVP